MKRFYQSSWNYFAPWAGAFGGAFRSAFFWLVVLGYLARIFFMPITGQHDVMFMPWMTHFINLGNFNLYNYLFETYGQVVMVRPGIWAPYPFGFYAFTSIWIGFLEKVSGLNLAAWNSIWEVSHPARQVFMLKLAYLPFDLAIAYFLYRYAGRKGILLWAWSPVAVYTPFMMGQNDIYATAFSTAGIYFASREIGSHPEEPSKASRVPCKWGIISSLLIGIGATFKIFPLLFLPVLAILISRSWWQRFFYLGLGALVFFLAAAPFLSAPTFINGVLFNPEGLGLFKEAAFLNLKASPFLVGYGILLIVLFTRSRKELSRPDLPWLAGLLVLGLVFFSVSTPIYWLIWIMPLCIGAGKKEPGLILAWLGLQISFALLLLEQHPELNIALPIHLSNRFDFPFLSTTLSVYYPILLNLDNTFHPVLITIQFLALALILVLGFKAVFRPAEHERPVNAVVRFAWIPLLTMLAGLAGSLYLARDLVDQNITRSWQNQTLKPTDLIIQTLNPGSNINGIKLRVLDSEPNAFISVCLFIGNDPSKPPVVCQKKNAADWVENRMLYFRFDERIALSTGETAYLQIQNESPTAKITLPFAPDQTAGCLLPLNPAAACGTADASILSSLTSADFNSLIVVNVLQDRRLVFAISGVLIATLLVLAGIITSRQPRADG